MPSPSSSPLPQPALEPIELDFMNPPSRFKCCHVTRSGSCSEGVLVLRLLQAWPPVSTPLQNQQGTTRRRTTTTTRRDKCMSFILLRTSEGASSVPQAKPWLLLQYNNKRCKTKEQGVEVPRPHPTPPPPLAGIHIRTRDWTPPLARLLSDSVDDEQFHPWWLWMCFGWWYSLWGVSSSIMSLPPLRCECLPGDGSNSFMMIWMK